MGIFSQDIGIDLGTANTLIYVKGKGIVLREPTVVAIDKYEGKIVAVGEEAGQMTGRAPENIVVVKPLKDGVIADFEITQTMIKMLIKKINAGAIFKPRVLVCIPSGITEVERRAVEEAVMLSGAREVSLISEPMAAAMGAGLPVSSPKGTMVVDIGGGTTEVAVMSLGGVVASDSIRVAGDALSSAIVNYLKREHSVNIGDKMAEEIKIKIGSAYDTGKNDEFNAKGRDVSTGLPKTVTVTKSQIREAISENLEQILGAIKRTLENTPPELAADIMENGITLTGGGALIQDLGAYIKATTGIEAHVAEYPLDCVVVGTGRALESRSI